MIGYIFYTSNFLKLISRNILPHVHMQRKKELPAKDTPYTIIIGFNKDSQ